MMIDGKCRLCTQVIGRTATTHNCQVRPVTHVTVDFTGLEPLPVPAGATAPRSERRRLKAIVKRTPERCLQGKVIVVMPQVRWLRWCCWCCCCFADTQPGGLAAAAQPPPAACRLTPAACPLPPGRRRTC